MGWKRAYQARYAEKEKSQASDSFKRACFNWGIGRELYTAPFIWLQADRVAISVKDIGNGGKKYSTNERFRVVSIDYTANREMDRTGVALETVLKRYQIKTTKEMTPEMYRDAISGLKSPKAPRRHRPENKKEDRIWGRSLKNSGGG